MARAAVIGSGPNGLSAAIALARAGVAVTVYEGRETVGGAVATGELTLPGFRHDLGSSVYPLGVASPFFRSLPLGKFGLRWIEPPAPLAHPLDAEDGSAVLLEHDLAATAEGLGIDCRAYRSLMQPLGKEWARILPEILGPVMHWPQHPLALANFGRRAMQPATRLAGKFQGERARALFAGCAAHSVLPLTHAFSSAFALVLMAAGHAGGWPIAAGGAQSVADALAGYLRSLGGRIETGRWIQTLEELEEEIVFYDLSPAGLVKMAGEALAPAYRRVLEVFQHGPGAFKVDWALSQPIPWRQTECARAATVHLGGTLKEIAAAEAAAWQGKTTERPFVLLTQSSLFDPARAPEGRHTAWGYCHVPRGYSGAERPEEDPMLHAIEAQVERFAPGFRDCILARHVAGPVQLEAWNPNLVGGDLSGGAMIPEQLVLRPSLSPYR
ncbi:MAG TPA: NAD(P)/FAD-dependent oxidoreductase, partial [Acidobacteriaceae bacterium]|nr:NAD(P)/FAD-dependent oxidoreductase [Acidobacteriaceae bacterium]